MKTRTDRRTRYIPHTEAGETRTIPDHYTEETPVPPRDWDHILLKTALAAAVGFTGISVIWSAVSGGGLLATTATPFVAYPVALAYDAAWITCLILEWLARHDPDRRALPRRIGHAALAVAMVVIYAHGHLAGQSVAGAAGAAVSLIAKVLWILVLSQFTFELPERTRAWVRVSRAEIGAELAITQQRRQLDRMRSQSHALQLASGYTATPPVTATVARDATPPPPATPPAVAPVVPPKVLPPAAHAAAAERPARNTGRSAARHTRRARRTTPPPAPVAPSATLPPPPPPNQIPPGTTLLPVICAPRNTTPAAPLRPAATPVPPATQHPAPPLVDRVAAAATHAVAPVGDTEALLTVADVARLRGVKPGTVRSWVNRGKLTPATRDSDGRTVFHRDAVAALDTAPATRPVAPSQMEGGYA
ncbi:helix-turn-helix domain-containing protein [Streptomyces sp. NPDC088124]|uniref:helix-turn-helix domain-containing protein n=1 Tax=Streptomyces sp. NPDC088124 TaxID=3154654 RepID=UPI00341C9FCA